MKLFDKKIGSERKKRGETLVEVIIAIFVVAIGSGAATNLIVSALQANSFSRDNLIASNLAVEGIEAMRDIRDNNWLRFSYDREECWNVMPAEDCKSGGALIDGASYTVDLDPANYYQWGLTVATENDLDLHDTTTVDNDEYRLSLIDVDTSFDSDGSSSNSDDPDLYVSKTIADSLSGNEAKVDDTKFYRMVKVTYTGGDPANDDEMEVTSVVQWRTGGAVHEVSYSSYLTNYRKVKK